MKNILIVDDSKFILAYVEDALVDLQDTSITKLLSYKETETVLENRSFHVAILDLNLPDAQNGEIVDLVHRYNIPIIVLTATMNEDTRKIILQKDIIEYVLKKNPKNISYVASIVKRVLANYDEHILVVDDSQTTRLILRIQLEKLHLNVVEAASAQEAIEIIESASVHISMVITDYEMPGMNGVDLTIELRERYNKNQLSIIALSGSESTDIATDFLKHGANDFIKKPFTAEELATRVNINLDVIDLFHELQESANKDFLTGLFNRRYFFEQAELLYNTIQREHDPLVIAMIDIDHFKSINDTYGHHIGDEALKGLAQLFEDPSLKHSIVARFGGEEFCILSKCSHISGSDDFFENIRKKVENNIINVGPISFKYTISIGVYCGINNTLEEMIKFADDKLYKAKEQGRNRVVFDSNCKVTR